MVDFLSGCGQTKDWTFLFNLSTTVNVFELTLQLNEDL